MVGVEKRGATTTFLILFLLRLVKTPFPTCNCIGPPEPGRLFGAAEETEEEEEYSLQGYRVFNVFHFGAKADGQTDSAPSLNRALSAACKCKSKAVVVIPQGYYYVGTVRVHGPCRSPSLAVVINGMVRAAGSSHLTGGADGAEWFTFDNINNLIVTGSGTLHGQGDKEWPSHGSQSTNYKRLAASLMFNKVSKGVVRDIRSINPKGFHIFVTNSENFRVFGVHLVAPASSPNTDGIHISKSRDIRIYRSSIATGDDCVSMIHGSKDISIKQVTCGPGHGYSVGSLGHYDEENDVSGISVKNCTMVDTDNGLRIKTYKGSHPSRAFNIHFIDIIMIRVRNPIIIDQEYGDNTSQKPSRVAISDVYFQNVRGTTTTKVAVALICSKAVPCQGIHLGNINLKYINDKPDHHHHQKPFSSFCANAKVVYFGLQSPPPCFSSSFTPSSPNLHHHYN